MEDQLHLYKYEAAFPQDHTYQVWLHVVGQLCRRLESKKVIDNG
jgi:hypothetical protein